VPKDKLERPRFQREHSRKRGERGFDILGIDLAQFHWFSIVSTEAAQAMVAFCFGTPGMHRVWAVVTVWKASSMRVLVNVGMRYEGYPRASLPISGKWATRSCTP